MPTSQEADHRQTDIKKAIVVTTLTFIPAWKAQDGNHNGAEHKASESKSASPSESPSDQQRKKPRKKPQVKILIGLHLLAVASVGLSLNFAHLKTSITIIVVCSHFVGIPLVVGLAVSIILWCLLHHIKHLGKEKQATASNNHHEKRTENSVTCFGFFRRKKEIPQKNAPKKNAPKKEVCTSPLQEPEYTSPWTRPDPFAHLSLPKGS